jgi:hypothetical protein
MSGARDDPTDAKANSRIDAELWRENRAACRIVREHEGRTAAGHIVRGADGSWNFEYDVSGAAEEESGYHLADECEYVSVVRDDGAYPYRVTAVSEI